MITPLPGYYKTIILMDLVAKMEEDVQNVPQTVL